MKKPIRVFLRFLVLFLWVMPFAWADTSKLQGNPSPVPLVPSPTHASATTSPTPTPWLIAQDPPAEADVTADTVGPAMHITKAEPRRRLVLKPGSALWVKGSTTQWAFVLKADILLGSAILKAPLKTAGGENALLAVVQKEGVQAMTLVVPVDHLKSTDVTIAKNKNYSMAGPHQALKGGNYPYVQFRLEDEKLGEGSQTGVYSLKASGKLTVGGVTRDTPLKAEAVFSGTQVRVKGVYHLTLEDFKVEPRTDIWGPMKPASVEVHFDVVFSLEETAARQQK